MRIQRVQDSVHGLMEFLGMEGSVVEVLRTEELQRLRRIRQLGLIHLVFPGAEHSRLVHSIGTAYVAIRFGRQLFENTKDFLSSALQPSASEIRDFALAALCHDLGHGPLSHVFEREVVGENFERDKYKWADSLGVSKEVADSTSKWHELVGQALLNWPEGQLLLSIYEMGHF